MASLWRLFGRLNRSLARSETPKRHKAAQGRPGPHLLMILELLEFMFDEFEGFWIASFMNLGAGFVDFEWLVCFMF